MACMCTEPPSMPSCSTSRMLSWSYGVLILHSSLLNILLHNYVYLQSQRFRQKVA